MDTYQRVNNFLASCFRKIEQDAPKPQIINIGTRKALRYPDQLLEIAILQKLARYISGLNSSYILLSHGYTQEVGVIFRTLDEFHEDIFFLCIPLNGQEKSKLHEDYLKDFFQEEYDNPNSAFLSSQIRNTISRRNIHSALAENLKDVLNPSDGKRNFRSLSQTYSGYVHGTSVHIIEMINGENLKYSLNGMPATYRQNEFIFNYWDYAYRGITTMMHVAYTFGYNEIVSKCLAFRDTFEKETGDTGQGDAEKFLRKMKSKVKEPYKPAN